MQDYEALGFLRSTAGEEILRYAQNDNGRETCYQFIFIFRYTVNRRLMQLFPANDYYFKPKIS